MPTDFLSRVEAWDGEAVVTRLDRATGAWIFICLHSTTLGQPTGGTRMQVYPRPEDGLHDAMRLAEGMTYKWAVLDLPFGGAKGVMALARPVQGEERRGLLRRYGQLVESLRGAFATGEDLGTTPQDMAAIAETTSFVHGTGIHGHGEAVADPGPFTARGVYAGVRAALAQVFGSADPAGRSVLVQGVGDVGGPLARTLAAAGARVLLSDLDEGRLAELAGDLGAEVVAPATAHGTPCDVFAPCAVGGVLNERTIGELACRIVAGSANNQLAEAADGERLHQRGILYAPDYVINGGGAMAFGLFALGEKDPEATMVRMDEVGQTLDAIFTEAAAAGESPVHAAHRRARRILERGPARVPVSGVTVPA